MGSQVTANRLGQRLVSPKFKQPSSTTKSDVRHERMLCSCKLRLRRDEPDGRLTHWPSGSSWPPSALCRRGQDLQLQRPHRGSVSSSAGSGGREERAGANRTSNRLTRSQRRGSRAIRMFRSFNRRLPWLFVLVLCASSTRTRNRRYGIEHEHEHDENDASTC